MATTRIREQFKYDPVQYSLDNLFGLDLRTNRLAFHMLSRIRANVKTERVRRTLRTLVFMLDICFLGPTYPKPK
jgi:hypothetical protein